MRDGDKIYEVRNSPIHGKGVFAARDIKKGERIIEYLGEKISKEESNRRGVEREELAKKTGEGAVYIFELDDQWDIDGNFDVLRQRLWNGGKKRGQRERKMFYNARCVNKGL